MDHWSTEHISAVTAMVAVVVGPMVSVYVARKQINASVLSSNRQAWINTLRDQLSELIGVLGIIHTYVYSTEVHGDDFSKQIERALALESKIQLLTNPNESDHVELTTLIRKAVLHALSTQTERKEGGQTFGEIRQSILAKAQPILKREWVRVKDGH